MKKLFAMVLCCLMLVPLVACDGATPEAYNSPTIQSTASQLAEMEEVEATPTPTPIPTPTPTPTPTPVSTPTPVPVISTPAPVQSAGVFVGSVQSDKYHYPSCRYAKKIIDYNEIWFSSAADAQSHGYVACKVCHPPS